MKILCALLLAAASSLYAQSVPINGVWTGVATVKGHTVPLTLQIEGTPEHLRGALVNGPEQSPASSVTLTGNHLVLTFSDYARILDATVEGGRLSGTFGSRTSTVPLSLEHHAPVIPRESALGPTGEWEIAVRSSKGESAWQLHIDALAPGQSKAVIQRIDGDTGALYGSWDAAQKTYSLSHFTAAGPALYTVVAGADNTLLITNELNDKQVNLIARRPEQARRENLPAPTNPTEQTTFKNPAEPLRFSAPDLNGKIVSNTDPQFDGKVVIVAVGGSWCPNCHDEAPFLESLYKQFHQRGLEVVDLSFEEADQLKDPTRLHAFINKYGLTYTVLVAGQPDQLTEMLPQFNDLNCWPTSIFVGRDGRVKEIHAGFAGPANPAAHEALKKNLTALVEQLLSEPIPVQNALR